VLRALRRPGGALEEGLGLLAVRDGDHHERARGLPRRVQQRERGLVSEPRCHVALEGDTGARLREPAQRGLAQPRERRKSLGQVERLAHGRTVGVRRDVEVDERVGGHEPCRARVGRL
jgi:hypothetical protein